MYEELPRVRLSASTAELHAAFPAIAPVDAHLVYRVCTSSNLVQRYLSVSDRMWDGEQTVSLAQVSYLHGPLVVVVVGAATPERKN